MLREFRTPFLSIVVSALLLCAPLARVSRGDGPATSPAFPGEKTQWEGCDRYDFPIDGKTATVVVPQKPAAGNPWLWRGEFFGVFPSVDQDLLKKGWYIVYINCADTFGSPDTMQHWLALYNDLTEKHGLSKKPVFYAMSRGGLYVYNWSALHPDKVGLIYGDAPVCDTKSWPGGKGHGTGSPGEWDRFKTVYGFKTDLDALNFRGNPIDELEPIAKAHIPIIHVVGDADVNVPVDENTTVLKDRYEKLGGHVELIVKHGVGHHPHSLTDPTPIVDYILKNRIVE